MKNNQEEICNAIMCWMTLLWILFGACIIGLTLTILKGVLSYFGIENNL